MSQVKVQWVDKQSLLKNKVEGRFTVSGNDTVPVVTLASLAGVVEGLRLALDYYRSKGTQKFNPYEIERRLENILTQLEAHTKEAE